MKLELLDSEIKLYLTLLEISDPLNVYTQKTRSKIIDQYKEQQQPDVRFAEKTTSSLKENIK